MIIRFLGRLVSLLPVVLLSLLLISAVDLPAQGPPGPPGPPGPSSNVSLIVTYLLESNV